MPFIEWKDEYNVGVESIDAQHQLLANIVNTLHNSAVMGMSDDCFSGLFSSLLESAFMHFKHEEDYIEETDYPGAEQHKQKHEELRQLIAQYREEGSNRIDPKKSLEIMKHLQTWLMDHVVDEDKRLGLHLNGQGIH